MRKVFPVLLAGGAGTRLWPVSRKSYPKQFSKLIDDISLFQASAQRLTSSEIIEFAPHITLTNSEFRFIIGEQLYEIGIDPGPILIEPEAKNTAAAILAASIFAYSKDENAVLLVAPSDHVISETSHFHEAIKIGLSYLSRGKIVTFGIQPTHPETGYGYQKISSTKLDDHGTSVVENFVEKPDFDKAAYMLETGNFLWNSGIFLYQAKDMIDAFKTYAPKTLNLISQSLLEASEDLGFLRLAPEPWTKLNDISIDHAIMEHARNLVVVPYNSKWSDLGDWNAVWFEGDPDSFGNVTSETAHAIDCTNSLIRSESHSQQVIGIGLDNIMAVTMPDAVLVAKMERSQDVKKAVALLKTKGIPQSEIFPRDHRPWGWFESLSLGDRFQVKRICVNPGGALSLQSHNHRSEHWIIVEGTAKVTIDKEVSLVTEGESVYVPLGAVHRIENPGKLPVFLIEVQIGTYFGEDDIIRYADVYSRT